MLNLRPQCWHWYGILSESASPWSTLSVMADWRTLACFNEITLIWKQITDGLIAQGNILHILKFNQRYIFGHSFFALSLSLSLSLTHTHTHTHAHIHTHTLSLSSSCHRFLFGCPILSSEIPLSLYFQNSYLIFFALSVFKLISFSLFYPVNIFPHFPSLSFPFVVPPLSLSLCILLFSFPLFLALPFLPFFFFPSYFVFIFLCPCKSFFNLLICCFNVSPTLIVPTYFIPYSLSYSFMFIYSLFSSFFLCLSLLHFYFRSFIFFCTTLCVC